MLMRSTMMVLCLAAFGCDVDPEIEPDPTSSSGTTAPTTSGTGGDGQGGDGAGGDGAGGTTMPGGGYESGTRLKVRTLVHPGRVSGVRPRGLVHGQRFEFQLVPVDHAEILRGQLRELTGLLVAHEEKDPSLSRTRLTVYD